MHFRFGVFLVELWRGPAAVALPVALPRARALWTEGVETDGKLDTAPRIGR